MISFYLQKDDFGKDGGNFGEKRNHSYVVHAFIFAPVFLLIVLASFLTGANLMGYLSHNYKC